MAGKHVKNGFPFPYAPKANSGPLAFGIYQLVSAATILLNNQVKAQLAYNNKYLCIWMVGLVALMISSGLTAGWWLI